MVVFERQAWDTAHALVLAAAAANDPAALAAAGDTLAALRAAGDGYAYSEQERAAFEPVCAIAAGLLAAGELGPARRVLAGFEAAEVEHRVVCALDAGDPELAYVRLGALPETGLIPSAPAHWALVREVVAQVARALAGGDKQHVLIGLDAFTRATYGETEEYVHGVGRAAAAARSLALAEDAEAQALAVVRMCSRRSSGEHGTLFAECAASLIEAPVLPGLIEEMARHARVVLDRRYRPGPLRYVARDAILHGRRDELAARVAALPARKSRYADPAQLVREAEAEIEALLARGTSPTAPMPGTADLVDAAPRVVATWEVSSGLLALLEPPAEPFAHLHLRLDGARDGAWCAELIPSGPGAGFLVAYHASARRTPREACWVRLAHRLVEAESGQLAVVDRLHRVDAALRRGAGALLEVPAGCWSEVYVAYAGPLVVGVGVAFVETEDDA